jgi:DNA-3-methyladenine glycosylase
MTGLPYDTISLARALIGVVLVRDDWRIAGRIVETEAYPPGDPASHAFIGRRPRNGAMFLAPFHAYVYMSYGVHMCFNISSEAEGVGAAVLVRALEPVVGEDLNMTGPGRLAKSLEIDRALDGHALLRKGALWLSPADRKPQKVGTSTRIGITKAAQKRLRFYERGNPFVSGPKLLSP